VLIECTNQHKYNKKNVVAGEGFINKLGKFEKLGTSRAQAASLQCKVLHMHMEHEHCYVLDFLGTLGMGGLGYQITSLKLAARGKEFLNYLSYRNHPAHS